MGGGEWESGVSGVISDFCVDLDEGGNENVGKGSVGVECLYTHEVDFLTQVVESVYNITVSGIHKCTPPLLHNVQTRVSILEQLGILASRDVHLATHHLVLGFGLLHIRVLLIVAPLPYFD